MLKRLLLTTLLTTTLALAGPTAAARGRAPGSDAAAAPKQGQSVKAPRPGMVWVNTKSRVYHPDGSQHAGKTKEGFWMTEAEAKAKGYKAAGTPSGRPKPSAAPSGKHAPRGH